MLKVEEQLYREDSKFGTSNCHVLPRGEIEPDEITPLSRPYLERIAAVRRLSLDRPNRIERLQDAARGYNSMKNGAYGMDVRPTTESTIRPFGPVAGEPLVPEFGLAKIRYPYLQEDLDEAESVIGRYDRNRDGYIDREEAARNRWTHRDPFEMDLNKELHVEPHIQLHEECHLKFQMDPHRHSQTLTDTHRDTQRHTHAHTHTHSAWA